MEPPYGIIAGLFNKRRVVPFLGAGASIAQRPDGAPWSPAAHAFLPSGLDLAHLLADESELPSTDDRDRDDLARVASYFVHVAGRSVLRERLRDLLNNDYEPASVHTFLARDVPPPPVIVVTNYDTLLEQAFRAARKPYDLVVYPADRKDFANAVLWWPHGAPQPQAVEANKLDIDFSRTTAIFKMHGTIVREAAEWDNYVITEEDYVEFLSRLTTSSAIPSIFFPLFRERSFLFLGYGLRDWNLRVLLRNLSKHLASRGSTGRADDEVLPSWAIQRRPSPLEQRLWQSNFVNIFDCTLDDFVAKLQKRTTQ
jgi:hypothetical protein